MSVFTKDDLLYFNELMLGRGMPVQEDGIGYNKADYGACANYFNGLSYAQLADLAKRLVKYTETQLKVDKDLMKDTARYYKELAGDTDKNNGVSIDIRDDETLIGFRYNELFVEIIKKQPKRRWDADSKHWIVPNSEVINVLQSLADVGADTDCAIQYAYQNGVKHCDDIAKTDIKIRIDGDFTLMKFDYNKDIVDAIKEIPHKDRQWNQDFKFWAIKSTYLEGLKNQLSNVADFKQIN